MAPSTCLQAWFPPERTCQWPTTTHSSGTLWLVSSKQLAAYGWIWYAALTSSTTGCWLARLPGIGTMPPHNSTRHLYSKCNPPNPETPWEPGAGNTSHPCCRLFQAPLQRKGQYFALAADLLFIPSSRAHTRQDMMLIRRAENKPVFQSHKKKSRHSCTELGAAGGCWQVWWHCWYNCLTTMQMGQWTWNNRNRQSLLPLPWLLVFIPKQFKQGNTSRCVRRAGTGDRGWGPENPTFLALAAGHAHRLGLCPKDKTALCSSENKLDLQIAMVPPVFKCKDIFLPSFSIQPMAHAALSTTQVVRRGFSPWTCLDSCWM